MLITQLKSEEELIKLFTNAPVFVFKCFGCKEVFFPVKELEKFLCKVTHLSGDVAVDYLCNYEFAKQYIKKYQTEIYNSKAVVVFSCGVGIQSVSSVLNEDKIVPPLKVYTGCNTFYLSGFQGLTSQRFNCNLCGECYLNYTGGICPLTACSKSLLNGPCGGAKEGKCEVSKDIDCGWEKIYKKLDKLQKTEEMVKSIKLRNYSKLL